MPRLDLGFQHRCWLHLPRSIRPAVEIASTRCQNLRSVRGFTSPLDALRSCNMASRGSAACALFFATALLVTGCGSGGKHGSGTNRRSAGRSLAPGAKALPPPSRFLAVHARAHSVTITLIAAYDGANDGFNFDGYSRELMWTVPRGWIVRVACTNRGPLRHSCAVVQGASSTTPAFPGAATPQPSIGLEAGHTAYFSFNASRTGVYRFVCLVAGHEAARMWDVLQIVRRGPPSAVSLLAK